MRHRVAHRKLGRVTEHRISLLRNQATALLRHEHIETTVPKARELRPFVERLITVAKRGIAAGDAEKKLMNARRHVSEDLADAKVVDKLFARSRAALPGAAGRLYPPAEGRAAARRQRRHGPHRAGRERVQPEPRGRRRKRAEAPKAGGVRGRLQAAASRLRGKKAAPAAEARPRREGRAEEARDEEAKTRRIAVGATTRSAADGSRRTKGPARGLSCVRRSSVRHR